MESLSSLYPLALGFKTVDFEHKTERVSKCGDREAIFVQIDIFTTFSLYSSDLAPSGYHLFDAMKE